MLKEEFLSKVKSKGIHYNENNGFEYDYSLIPDNFKSSDKILIICKKHGKFEQRASNHLLGQSCMQCAIIEKTMKACKTTKQFIIDAKSVHGNKYDYSLVEYKNNRTKVKIICPIHGEFEQKSHAHLSGQGCPKCGIESAKQNRNQYKTTEQFIIDAKSVHGNKYDYSLVEYKNHREKVKIICSIHGEFEQRPELHLQGSGCQQCAADKKTSFAEYNIRKFINNKLKFETINNSRNILDGQEIDIFIDDLKVGIEFNGIYTHRIGYKPHNYHYYKFTKTLSKGIKLYNIFEDSFNNNINAVKSFIIKKLNIKELLTIIDEFSRKNLFYDDKKVDNFLLENDINYQYTIDESLIYHCLFDNKGEIIKCYIIRENTIIKIVEKNYVHVNDDLMYFKGYNLLIDLCYQSPLEKQFINLKVKEIIKPQIIRKEKYDIENCGYIIYNI